MVGDSLDQIVTNQVMLCTREVKGWRKLTGPAAGNMNERNV